MKESKVDELFKHKLRNLDKTPSPEAWDKIHMNLNHNKNGFIIWKVAAGIILFTSLAFLIYQLTPNESTKSIADKSQISQEENDLNETNKEPIRQQEQAVTQNQGLNPDLIVDSPAKSDDYTGKLEDSRNVSTKEGSNKNQVAKEKPIEPIEPTETLAVMSTEKQKISDDQVQPVDSLASTSSTQTLAVAETEKERPVITITYKKSPNTQKNATIAQNESKDHAFKKLISYAKDIKNGEIGLSDIRNAKDELFAVEINLKKINFSKEKN